MTLMAGNIVEGTVVNITNFGAFIEVEGKTGLVHISEVADSYVKDIREHLNEQDKVKANGNFEDIMSKFLKDSEERMQDVKKHQEFKSKGGRKGC